MSSKRGLDSCGCCDGVTRHTPEELDNRPGLDKLDYRIGTHAKFKSSMLAGLSAEARLRRLTTRQDDDFSIALIDSWAAVLDILSFYDERIANEGFLATAMERRSVLEMARLIGYELGPGVAASTYLAFTLDDREGSPTEITIPKGTRAQSVPGQDELPQTFETWDDLVARPEWNELLPRQTHSQTFTADTREFYVKGIATQLSQGDPVLLVWKDKAAGEPLPVKLVPLIVNDLETYSDAESKVEWTRLTLVLNPDESQTVSGFGFITPKYATFSYARQEFTEPYVKDQVLDQSWSSGLLSAFTQVQGWPLLALGTYLLANRSVATSEADEGLFALRTRASAFGHNALHYKTLPSEWQGHYTNDWDNKDTTTTHKVPAVNQDSFGGNHETTGDGIYLDREYPDIVAGSFVVVQGIGDEAEVFTVESVSHESVTDFGLSGKSTKLTLATIDDGTPSMVSDLNNTNYPFRKATIETQSEALELIELPIENDVEGQQVELEQVDLLLEPGRTVIVRGERVDLPGVVDAEAAEISAVDQVEGYTRLTFKESLTHAYVRSTTVIHANVAAATHGESRSETLGSGDGSRKFQQFDFSKSPLTHVSAATDSGSESTAGVRIDGVLWHESPDFYRLGAEDRQYVLRRHDSGKTRVVFGDGIHGARLPTGVENVKGEYRFGIGTEGHVDVNKITLLSSPPLGVREVKNPVAASGGEDPETLDDSRDNAPTTVKTLDRIVSLTDFEDYARTFGGIVKARADWVWDGTRRRVLVTVSGAGGDEVSATLMDTLRDAMNDRRDPFQPMVLRNYKPLFFEVEASLVIDPDYVGETVLAQADQALRDAFSFDEGRFARGLHRSRIVALLHGVDGVTAVDLTLLRLVPTDEEEAEADPVSVNRIDAEAGRLAENEDGVEDFVGADLLVITPEPLTLTGKS